ncbi:hypothetical protein SY27_15855 [Flavobacterium sp. 316]|uniref:Type IX secretion system membrane protein PorP/SprF n=1 Tax=Flavobacterium sediminilitoris TaxID=2024526 RepID=A0ABY4HMI4_9FLAO|nr:MULTISPECIES: hypothetical protein [Flavobacterium]KIX19992.1 hypothetical protein SY27_15855 [Flavobacterium sp. 316]UOX33788.1 hypothetical protein LXD69_17355 [Flavobacterium sediminilitoris]
MKKILIIFVITFFQNSKAQELFVVTDPASNVPTNSLSIRLANTFFERTIDNKYNYSFNPEVTYGLNKNLMFRGTIFNSNRNGNFEFSGANIYSKYRFFSSDDLNSHFRMAAYGRLGFNNSPIHQEQIEIMGQNGGFEAGIVATKLIHKIAISSSVSFEKVFNNGSENPFPDNLGNNATNYTLSFGKLMYPKKYTNYKQTNINLMLEFVGQTINENGKSYLDVIPAIQFIINSQARIDLAYKRELINSMQRTAPNGFYLNFEYTFFNL